MSDISTTFVGTLTQDATDHSTVGGYKFKVLKLVCVTKPLKKPNISEKLFVNVVFWQDNFELANRIHSYLIKNTKLLIIAKVVGINSFTGKNGEEFRTLETTGLNITFISSRRTMCQNCSGERESRDLSDHFFK